MHRRSREQSHAMNYLMERASSNPNTLIEQSHARVHARTNERMHAHMHKCMHACTNAYTHAHTKLFAMVSASEYLDIIQYGIMNRNSGS